MFIKMECIQWPGITFDRLANILNAGCVSCLLISVVIKLQQQQQQQGQWQRRGDGQIINNNEPPPHNVLYPFSIYSTLFEVCVRVCLDPC